MLTSPHPSFGLIFTVALTCTSGCWRGYRIPPSEIAYRHHSVRWAYKTGGEICLAQLGLSALVVPQSISHPIGRISTDGYWIRVDEQDYGPGAWDVWRPSYVIDPISGGAHVPLSWDGVKSARRLESTEIGKSQLVPDGHPRYGWAAELDSGLTILYGFPRGIALARTGNLRGEIPIFRFEGQTDTNELKVLELDRGNLIIAGRFWLICVYTDDIRELEAPNRTDRCYDMGWRMNDHENRP